MTCRHCSKPYAKCDCPDDSGFNPPAATPQVGRARLPRWYGMCKLTEECGEVIQLLGKLGAFPSGDHPDGKGPLKERLEDELADVAAASRYFIEVNGLDQARMTARAHVKYAKFKQWGLEGTTP